MTQRFHSRKFDSRKNKAYILAVRYHEASM